MSSSASPTFSTPSAASASPSSTAVSLESLLSSLSYADKGRLLSDLSSLLSQTNSLSPHLSPVHAASLTASLSSSSGSVLALTGTLPIYYRSHCYHIPVSLLIPEEYPFRPPLAYVTPTRDMRIKERHPHVDSQGLVYLPYLHHWGPDSGLVELVSVMASVFSEDPPVFKQATAAAASSSPSSPAPNILPPLSSLHSAQQEHAQAAVAVASSRMHAGLGFSAASSSPHHSALPLLSSSSASSSSSAAFAQQPPALPASSSSSSISFSQPSLLPPALPSSSSFPSASSLVSPSPTPSPEPLSPLTVARHRLLSSLTRRAQEQLRAHHSDASQDMDRSLAQQEQIRTRRAALEAELHTAEQESRQLEEAREAIRSKRKEVDDWLSLHEAGAGLRGVDELVWCRDTWMRQLLESVSMDVALDDCMTALDRALSEGRLDVDKWVKLMRGVSRQQFFHKQTALHAHTRLAEAKQQQQSPQQQQQPRVLAMGGRR